MSEQRPKVCVGFGEQYGVCRGPQDPRSAYWCRACELARREHISAQFKQLLDTWPAKDPA